MAKKLASELVQGDKLESPGGVLTVLRARTMWPNTSVIAVDSRGVSTGWINYNAHDEFETVTVH